MTDPVQRADHAKRILDDELVKEALQSIEDELTKGWKDSPAQDKEGRERIFQMLCVVQSFRGFFERVMNDGKVHAYNVQQLRRGQL